MDGEWEIAGFSKEKRVFLASFLLTYRTKVPNKLFTAAKQRKEQDLACFLRQSLNNHRFP